MADMNSSDGVSLSAPSQTASSSPGRPRAKAKAKADAPGKRLAVRIVLSVLALMLAFYLVAPMDHRREVNLATAAERSSLSFAGIHLYDSQTETPLSRWLAASGVAPGRDTWMLAGGSHATTWFTFGEAYKPSAPCISAQLILRYIQSQPEANQAKMLKAYQSMIERMGLGLSPEQLDDPKLSTPLARLEAQQEFAATSASARSAIKE